MSSSTPLPVSAPAPEPPPPPVPEPSVAPAGPPAATRAAPRHRQRGAGVARSAGRILQAARDLLAERGYSALTVEAVAAAARVGKSTIYRWWPSKEALLADALAEVFRGEEIPDLGDTRAELRIAVEMTIENYVGEALPLALPALAADCARDPRLLTRFREVFLLRKREHVTVALRRAVARGDLPDTLDTELVQDVWAGTILYRRLLSGLPLDDAFADRMVRLVLVAGATLSVSGDVSAGGQESVLGGEQARLEA